MLNSFLVIFRYLADIVWVEKFENTARMARWTWVAEGRPEWGVKRETESRAEPRGFRRDLERDFEIFQPAKYRAKTRQNTHQLTN